MQKHLWYKQVQTSKVESYTMPKNEFLYVTGFGKTDNYAQR